MDARATDRLIAVGETLHKTVRLSRDAIVAFAHMTDDSNPLHHDTLAAQRAHFGEIIASGQQTASVLMGLLASHFTRSTDGLKREMLCLNMNFAFKGPVFADQELTLDWKVHTVQWNGKLQGMLAHLDGHASVPPGRAAVVARGTIVVKDGA